MSEIEKTKCRKFETCSAALCPKDSNPRRYWYSDTEVCALVDVPGWVKTQRRIAKVNPDPHCYYTQRMLEAITRVKPGILGVEAVGYSKTAEADWLEELERGRGRDLFQKPA